MNIVFLTSEAHPYAKTGGLADVSFALPAALAQRGHKVSVIMPYYKQQMRKLNLKIHSTHDLLSVPFGERREFAQILEHRLDENLTFYFIEFNLFFDRPALYDWDGTEYPDNGERFIFFSRAAMQAIVKLKLEPYILHTNDWHTALCNVYLHSLLYWSEPAFKHCKSVMTIHNIGYQGVFNKSNLMWTGLPWDFFNIYCLEFYDQLNLMKSGIMTADIVSTVSPTYAREILLPEFSFNLHHSLANCASRGKLRGILNGINTVQWDPEKDPYLPEKYSKADFTGKIICKAELQKKFSLPLRPDVPLFGVLSRLAYQKGVDVLIEALKDILLHDDVQFVIVGSGEKWLQEKLNDLAYHNATKVGVYIGYCSDELAHLVEAGCDMFVMPSRYEPCGLNQMYSMRYGTVPIVRATGGLDDTIDSYDPSKMKSTGFKFWDLYPQSLVDTVRWAASVYNHDKIGFKHMQINGMSRDFSWSQTASHYEQLYEDAHRTV